MVREEDSRKDGKYRTPASQGTTWLVQLPCRFAGASTFCVAQRGLSLDPAGCWVRGWVLTTSHCKDPGAYSY